MKTTDPTKINLAQADLLRRLVEAGPAGLPRDLVPFATLVAMERRGLVRLLTEPTGLARPAWRQTWLATDLGRQVLAGGLVHTDHERQADGSTRLLIFLNGKQAGEVKTESHWSLGKLVQNWIGTTNSGATRTFQKKAKAVAWVAGGAR